VRRPNPVQPSRRIPAGSRPTGAEIEHIDLSLHQRYRAAPDERFNDAIQIERMAAPDR
jgi:hypothetical protein